MGYPSALNTIVQYSLTNNRYPHPGKGVFTTSETVSNIIRSNIEKA